MILRLVLNKSFVVDVGVLPDISKRKIARYLIDNKLEIVKNTPSFVAYYS